MQDSLALSGSDSIISGEVLGSPYLPKGKVVVKDMTAETYLRRGKRRLRRALENPGLRLTLRVLGLGLAGFLLSAASLRRSPQPIAMGAIAALSGWQALVMTLGSMLGYRFFWGPPGIQGAVWAAAGGLLALVTGGRKIMRERPLLQGAMVSALAAGLGLLWQILREEPGPMSLFFLQILTAGASALLMNQLRWSGDSLPRWIGGGVCTLALAQVVPLPFFGLGYLGAGLLAAVGTFPAGVMAGLGLDLAQVTAVPMTAVMCLAYLLRMLPFSAPWVRYCTPAASCLVLMAVSGQWDPMPLPALVLGGCLGMLVPVPRDTVYGRGPTGAAQVRLELTAGVLQKLRKLLMAETEPPIDRKALLEKARARACSGCPQRKHCAVQVRLGRVLQKNPLDVTCPRRDRLDEALRQTRDQLKIMISERRRREEYRGALLQQYGFHSQYLGGLANQRPRRGQRLRCSYTVEVSARSQGKYPVSGDRCLAFSGIGCRYYLLLCDGMGTGPGADIEGSTAGELIRQILSAGLPPRYALQTMNSLLALRGQAGAVTIDLAEIALDTGRALIYKWGAAPSYVLGDRGIQKIGTASAPPGLSLWERRQAVTRLSLRRGEVLILLSDGVDGQAALGRMEWEPEAPTGQLAEKLLARGKTQDDATAAVLRLHPSPPS